MLVNNNINQLKISQICTKKKSKRNGSPECGIFRLDLVVVVGNGRSFELRRSITGFTGDGATGCWFGACSSLVPVKSCKNKLKIEKGKGTGNGRSCCSLEMGSFSGGFRWFGVRVLRLFGVTNGFERALVAVGEGENGGKEDDRRKREKGQWWLFVGANLVHRRWVLQH
ncbi:hypothetical protein R3W88_016558 [Solanum pinnatisectum]|uniref:Uncharacterized protein n=1 Tax=Solanum pinnatisectum TaxID=50273 RepID=A0AAV9L0S8_9SOLN|nr:hypothetical protein R3W88_016558 [Solanum pinnatisectum]